MLDFQVTELQSLMAEKEVILGPDGKIVGNGINRTPKKDQNDHQKEQHTTASTNKLICPTCRFTFCFFILIVYYLDTKSINQVCIIDSSYLMELHVRGIFRVCFLHSKLIF